MGFPVIQSECINNRYFKIDHDLARHFQYNGTYLSSPPPLSMQSNDYPFFKFNDLHQSGNRVLILASAVVESLHPYSSSIVKFLLYGQTKQKPRSIKLNNSKRKYTKCLH